MAVQNHQGTQNQVNARAPSFPIGTQELKPPNSLDLLDPFEQRTCGSNNDKVLTIVATTTPTAAVIHLEKSRVSDRAKCDCSRGDPGPGQGG